MRVEEVTVDDLAAPRFELLREMTHAQLTEFVVQYFLHHGSWVTRLHHGFALLNIGAIVAVAWAQHRSLLRCLTDFGVALAIMFVVMLPLHELVHAVAYRVVGARDIRWDWSARMMAVWVVAHRFVADTRAFLIVALAPFLLLNALLIAGAVAFPRQAVLLLFILLWHSHGSSGDWALLNFVWLHRHRGFWTFDDADEGKTYFFGRPA